MKTVYYWSPYLTNVATINAVINSAISLKKYSKKYEPIIINSCGEFDAYSEKLKKNKIKISNLITYNYHKFLPSKGFIQSRFSFLIIFLISFLPLLFLVKSKKPDYFIFHLVTSLPMIILNLVTSNTKFILRISGLPNYNKIRKLFWKNLGKKIYKITCPTLATINDLKMLKIFDEKKIFLLRDPIINIKKISKLKNQKSEFNFNNNDYLILSVGRLTKQKNFSFLIGCFDQILNLKKNAKLLIIGEGEEKNNLQKLIEQKNLSNKVFLLGFQENIYNYLKNANLFILSSLWEDPGWVLIEAAISDTLILSSNCKNGPSELIEKNNGGILFQNNSSKDLLKKFREINSLNEKEIFSKKLFVKKKTKKYTMFNHYLNLEKILN